MTDYVNEIKNRFTSGELGAEDLAKLVLEGFLNLEELKECLE